MEKFEKNIMDIDDEPKEELEDWEKELEKERKKREAEKEMYHKERKVILREKKRREKGGEKTIRSEYLAERIRRAAGARAKKGNQT